MNKKTTKKQVGLAKYLKLVSGLFLATISMMANAQTFDWAKSMGGSQDDEGYSVATDGSGNVYVTGFYNDTADFDPGYNILHLIANSAVDSSRWATFHILTTRYYPNVFVSKLDALGNLIWTKSMGGKGSDYGQGIAVDGSGNVYVTGYFDSDTVNFNPGGSGGTLINAGGGTDVFLAKYDASGNFLWAKNIGGSGTDNGQGIAVDGSGNVYITGYFNFIIDFNPGGSGGTLVNATLAPDVFLAKYDTGGNFLWAKGMGAIIPIWGRA